MPAKKMVPISQAEYLLDVIRHIEAVARAAHETVGLRADLKGPLPVPRVFGRGCDVMAEFIPRPFGRACGLMVDVDPEAGDKVGAGRTRGTALRSRKRAKR